METKIKLSVLGITFSQVQAGAYALVLAEENGLRRMPIIIGTPEAQSIAIFLEGLRPPRPLTHELFISFTEAVDVKLQEINIYKFEDGVFFSELIFMQNDKKIVIDSRTSDAIALAIRTQAPIYTTEQIMIDAGVILEEDVNNEIDDADLFEEKINLEEMSASELENTLQEAVSKEDYERASHIRDLIKNIKKPTE
ncbi:hypothetical protein AwDysgo_16360 [Bacteroidales bacterium]|nr:hypothetical protein AwDysgo_16360 [Bacteroidales bacterium]